MDRNMEKIKRTFSMGSEWLYYKIYCGVKTADIVLQDYLQESIAYLKEKEWIETWFFIRYNDPDSHLRLRFRITNLENLGKVLGLLNAVFSELEAQNLVWNLQTDSYARELERYGKTTYTLSEAIFQADSELILAYVDFKNLFESNATPLLFSFLSIDSFLNSFSLTLEAKMNLLENMQAAFKVEFHADKVLKKQLDKQYRGLENEITPFLAQTLPQFEPIYKVIAKKNEAMAATIEPILKDLDVSLSSFLNSHIHMMMNRQYTSRQRQYELVVYDHLFRYYRTVFYRNRSKF